MVSKPVVGSYAWLLICKPVNPEGTGENSLNAMRPFASAGRTPRSCVSPGMYHRPAVPSWNGGLRNGEKLKNRPTCPFGVMLLTIIQRSSPARAGDHE